MANHQSEKLSQENVKLKQWESLSNVMPNSNAFSKRLQNNKRDDMIAELCSHYQAFLTG